ncbi:MAG: branched-chain amino acid ABC transporter substrate-binding protein [Armatimonadota bacterium]|nr:branched-chain amino acid ABC transporter substrate-binding protein [Armatimonadota bacterium]MDR7420937.1 branched-chain amino acid ABC transporter substrate-binding protein [Armatimonadota bacterium]MDR7455121.1 branched-chain amino acid ABC transporter substrate-binding protein [Armatimonadota bacterium]MDR7456554.1 branched-chain amino acid ABC transporter substrate-binding protein [Armatimonadota bacterium]MDR7495867.1 branched-chain amino acid ABC transporter substrate-binding protein 
MKGSRVLAAVLAALAIAALSLPALPVQAQQLGTIKIATQSPLSGGQAALGEGIKNGAQLALEQLGGPLTRMGFRLELVPFDDQAKPDVGVANARNLVTDPAILLVVGHLNSGVAIPSSEVYKDSMLAMISPANTNPLITDRKLRNVFRIVGRDDVQGVVGAEYAATELKVKTVYILHDKTAYGQGVAEFFRQHAPKVGMRVLGFEGTEEKANFDPIINPIRARNPELVYFGGIYDQAGVFFKQARAKGLRSRFMGPDGMDSSELAKIAGSAIVGMTYSTVAGPTAVYPAAAKFARDYKAKYGKDPEPFAAQAYDAMAIGLAAIQRAVTANGGRRPTREQVTAEVHKTRAFKGLTGTFTFDAKGDPVPATYFVIQIVSGDPTKWGQNRLVKRLDIKPPSGSM